MIDVDVDATPSFCNPSLVSSSSDTFGFCARTGVDFTHERSFFLSVLIRNADAIVGRSSTSTRSSCSALATTRSVSIHLVL